MPAWLTSSRAAHFAAFGATIVASVVILATGSSVAYLGPVLVGGVALGTLVALALPQGGTPTETPEVGAVARATPSSGSGGTASRR